MATSSRQLSGVGKSGDGVKSPSICKGVKTEMKNTIFPGRPNYEGPTEGMFGLLHHDVLAEPSRDVSERVAYVKRHKPQSEVAARLHNMIYLGGGEVHPAAAKIAPLGSDYNAKRATLAADYNAQRGALYADYRTKLATLTADYRTQRDTLNAGSDYNAKRDTLTADYLAKRDTLDSDYTAKLDTLYADYNAKLATLTAEVLAYIKTHIPDCAWDGTTLVFSKE